MSQARVTDFYCHRRRGAAAPVKFAKPRSSTVVGRSFSADTAHFSHTRSRSIKNIDDSLCSPSVHEEFLRVIDEAAGLNDGETTSGGKVFPSSPRTPKRSSSEFDLGAAVFSATAEHSTAKKRRRIEAAQKVEVKTVEKVTRKKARKKLVLSQDSAQTRPIEVTQQPTAPDSPAAEQSSQNHVEVQSTSTSSSPQRSQVISKDGRGQASKALSKDDIASLKSRLQRIKKHAEGISAASSSASASKSSPFPSPTGTEPKTTTSAVHKTASPITSEARAVTFSVSRAKELAANAQKRKEEREAEERNRSEPQTHDSAEQPAYQRYHTLAQAAPPGLSLPYQYKVLAEMFRSLDTVVAMLHNRGETATFTKIKQGVQDMMHKRFEENHVAQIKTIFPKAYIFRQEKNIPTFNSSIKKGSYQLTVEPVIVSDQKEARPLLTASCLLERRRIFHQNLVSIVKQHHKVFLSSLVPPMSVPEDKLTRWHPRFNVDTVPAVQTGSLPHPPHTEKLSTAQEVLDKARSLITPKMEKALVSLALKTEQKGGESKEATSPQNSVPPTTSTTRVPAALKGVSQSLLDRIRAKEAQKLQTAMTRNTTQEDRLLVMSRLPELARILRNVFVAEKKPALTMEVACNKMMASYRSALNTGEMEKHIRLLAEVATDWLTIHPIRKDFYLKLSTNVNLNVVVDKLNRRLKEEEKI